jgi:hypothetical protein
MDNMKIIRCHYCNKPINTKSEFLLSFNAESRLRFIEDGIKGESGFFMLLAPDTPYHQECFFDQKEKILKSPNILSRRGFIFLMGRHDYLAGEFMYSPTGLLNLWVGGALFCGIILFLYFHGYITHQQSASDFKILIIIFAALIYILIIRLRVYFKYERHLK